MNLDVIFDLVFDYLPHSDLLKCELVDHLFRKICYRKFKSIKEIHSRKPLPRICYRNLAIWQEHQRRKVLSNDFFQIACRRFPYVEILHLRKVVFDASNLLPAADFWPNLRDFSIVDSKIDGKIILFNQFLKLVSLGLQKLTIFLDKPTLRGENFAEILIDCPKLRHLALKGDFASKFFPDYRFANFPVLETLRLQYDDKILNFLAKNQQVRELEFFEPFVSVDQLRQVTLRSTKNLRILKCMNFRIFANDPNFNVSSLSGVGSRLTSLTLIECRFKNMQFFEAINSTLVQLENLTVSFVNIEIDHTPMSINLQNLCKLDFLSLEYFNPNRADIFLLNLHFLSNLRHLCLKYVQIESDTFNFWSPRYLPRLKILDFHFRYWENMADLCSHGLENVEKIFLAFKIFHCPLYEREIDQHLFELARNYKNLRCLKLHRFNDTLSSLKFFAQCPEIHLEYQFCEQPGIGDTFRDFLLQDCRIDMQIFATHDLYKALMKNRGVQSALALRDFVKFSTMDIVL